MISLIAMSATTVVMALMLYVSKRRFGVPVFALAVGSFFASLWVEDVMIILQTLGVYIVALPLQLLVALVLLLAPAILTIGSGALYKKPASRLFGAMVFGVAAAAFMVAPFVEYIVVLPETRSTYEFITAYAPFVMTISLLFGLVDILLTKTHKPSKDDAKH